MRLAGDIARAGVMRSAFMIHLQDLKERDNIEMGLVASDCIHTGK
jgi:hypothetical protein